MKTELDKSFLGHIIVMARPILPDIGWQVRICRPAFQDFQRIFRRYYARSILSTGVRILFCEHSPNPSEPTLWVLGGLRIDEQFGDLQRTIFSGRSLIVQERAD